MPVMYRYSVVPEHKCVFIERGGKFSAGHFVQALGKIINDPEYKPGYNFLTDARKMDYAEANFAVLSHQVDLWEDISTKLDKCKLAFLHASQVNYGVSRQSKALFETENIDRKPFYKLEEALDWLGLPHEFDVSGALEAAEWHQEELPKDSSNSTNAA